MYTSAIHSKNNLHQNSKSKANVNQNQIGHSDEISIGAHDATTIDDDMTVVTGPPQDYTDAINVKHSQDVLMAQHTPDSQQATQ